jgi:dihydroorotate dehydrogenase electron transfer subunit
MKLPKMKEKFHENATVLAQSCIGSGIYDLWLDTNEIAWQARPGQFVSVYSADKSKLLPRPISLCNIESKEGSIRLVYRVTGEDTGTEEFSKLVPGDTLRILGPLGNGFTILPKKKAFLIGGGIGVPPMLELAKQCRKKRISFDIIMGYRDSNTFLLEEFQEEGHCYVATEDGSVGTKGNVLDAIRENDLSAEVIYACGPTPMLRALKSYAEEKGMQCFISLEERMACGIGACLACVCNSTEEDEHTHVKNKRICKEGPVFDAREVEL